MFMEQFKTILWKNWKIFKSRSSLFFCYFELFLTFVVITVLSIRTHENILLEKKSSEKASGLDNVFKDYYSSQGKGGLIAFVLPNTNNTEIDGDAFISNVMNDPNIKSAYGISYKKFESEKILEDFVYNETNDSILCGIVFDNDYTTYSIRIKGSNIVNSKEDPIWNYSISRRMEMVSQSNFKLGYGAGSVPQYTNPVESDKYKNVFIFIQMAVDNTIIQMKTKNSIHGYSVNLGKFAKQEIRYDSNIKSKDGREFEGLAPYLMLLCIGQFFHISNRLISEVEDNTKEGLISIGTNPIHLWITWEIIYFPLSLITFIAFALFDPSNILRSINPIILVLFYIFYVISMYHIAVIISLLFKKTKTVLVFVCMFVASMMSINKFIFKLKIDGQEKIEKIISGIFSPIGLSMGCEEICYESDHNRYIGFSNLFQSKFGFYFICAFVDMIAYFIIALILEYIRKIDFRTVGIKKSQMTKNNSKAHEDDIQEDPTDSECYVEVKNIYKFFKFRRSIGTVVDDNDKRLGKVFAANNDISFKVYKDEIFAILGHNGAGKSTLIQNMVGLIKPDHGETYYQGLPFSKNKKEIKKQFGICLQSNVLIKGFTVEDHFKLHCGIKGVKDMDFDSWIKEIDLVGKEHYEVQKMSGGQKRKLCIGLAIIGNPKYVFLDEPTTGLDPLSRRKIWNLLLKIKKNRVIFITTHYMDEADIIADRKLILSKGTIRCLGSSVYLKNHFKMRYNLEVETSDVQSINQIIQRHISDAIFYNDKTNVDKKSENSTSTYTWKLPVTASKQFSDLLNDLENEKGHLLKNFSLNAPLLEELFVNLNKEEEENQRKESNESQSKCLQLPKIENIERPGTFKTALRLSRYRIRVYLRQKTYWIMGILVPVAILLIFLPVINEKIKIFKFDDYEKREISSSMYKNQLWNYDVQNSNIIDKIPQNILQQELPKRNDQGGNVDSLEQLTIDKVNEESFLITKEPYFVSSISGNYNNGTYQFDVYYNDSLIHSLPSTLNTLSNVILSSNQINDTIHMSSYPFNYFNDFALSPMKLFATLVITFCFAFPLSLYGTNVVRERVQNLLKQLQLNGISNKSYWLSVLISDHMIFMVTSVLILTAFVICKFTPYFHCSIIVLLLIFIYICGFACLLFQYCVSYIFESESNAYLIFFAFNIVPPYLISIKAYIDNLETDVAGQFDIQLFIGIIIYVLATIFPSYSFVKVFRSLINVGIKHNAIGIDISLFSLLKVRYQIISCLLASITSIVIYSFVLTSLTKKRYNPKRKVLPCNDNIKKKYEDELLNSDDDVQKEHYRVLNDTDNQIPIKILQLSKEYDEIKFSSKQEITEALERKNPKYGQIHMSELGIGRIVVTPFENISLGIDKCECFGILGPNGSGKSSLLNTTSFTFPQSVGKIYYDGKDTLERKGNEIILGYCPQEDTLWNEFTLFEHIEMFLYLRGYSKKKAKSIAKDLIDFCHLTDHKNKMPYELSGGTRRKLNILIALCCSPSKIIMDEPSAGMDPSTRRYIWDVIKSTIQNEKSSIIMSTHSMEEAELLCNRIAIMVKGRLKCIGTPEHLKMKFGNSYILDVHSDDVEKFHNEVIVQGGLFENSNYTREDKSSHRVKYEVKNISKISHIFKRMETYRENGLITDYSFSHTSLEQIFLNTALEAFQDD